VALVCVVIAGSAAVYGDNNGQLSSVDLGTLAGLPESVARGINARGQIVGKSDFNIFAPIAPRATLWQMDATGRYVPIDLGPLGNFASDAFAINNRGQVVGIAETAEGPPHAFLWEDLNHNGASDLVEMIDLGTLGGFFSQAFAINERGQVVGSSQTADGLLHAFFWQDSNHNHVSDPGEMIDLGSIDQPNSDARGINNQGKVIGFEFLEAGEFARPLVWERGIISSLETAPDVLSARPLGVSDGGQIAGALSTLTPDMMDLITRAFVWDKGTFTELGTLGGPISSATGINSRGQAVGNSETGATDGLGQAIFRGFRWEDTNHNRISDPGEMTNLGTLGGDNSSAFGINNRGQVVGSAQIAGNAAFHAVLWTPVP
jgi:probable HAF family extracellular repeat protein